MAGPGKPGPPTKEEAALRRADIWNMAVAAYTQAEIAAKHGITQQRVSEILREACAQIEIPAAEAYRKVAADKLDKLERALRAVIDRHTEHDDPMVLAAADRMLKLEQRRAAMAGYDAPVKTEVTSYDYKVNGVEVDGLK